MACFHFIGRNQEAVFIADRRRANEMSLINQAEKACVECFACWGNRRIIYRDPDGRWDELRHDHGRFHGFSTIDAGTRRRWQEWLIEPEGATR